MLNLCWGGSTGGTLKTCSQKELACRYNLTRDKVRKWQSREDGADRSHRLRPPSRRPGKAVALRQTPLLLMDDLLAMVREFRSSTPPPPTPAWTAACTAAGVSNLQESPATRREEGTKRSLAPLQDDQPGFVHMEMSRFSLRCPTRNSAATFSPPSIGPLAGSEILPHKSVASAHGFLQRLVKVAAFTIEKVLTDNDKEW